MPLSWAYGDVAGFACWGRGPIPAPSAISGVVSRVGSFERSVEFHEQAILELERQVSVVDSLVTKVEEMDQLLAQLEHLSDEVKGTSLAVDELGVKLVIRVRDVAHPPGELVPCPRFPR